MNVKTIGIIDALKTLRPQSKWTLIGDDYSGLEWNDDTQSKPTEQEINDEIANLQAQQKLDDCKETAKQKIAATDWSVLPDVNITNKSEFEAYRATLRGYILNPVADPQWPVEPTPIWSQA